MVVFTENLLYNIQDNLTYLVAAIPIGYVAGSCIYNLFFHPLSSFPGPVLFRATPLTKIYYLLKGDLAFKVTDLHARYGPVVRIHPDELAYANPAAWKDIYGHHQGPEFSKLDVFYRMSDKDPDSIINAGREDHGFLRRQLSHGFSERSMRAQEPIINGYVNLLIRQLHERAGGGSTALNIKEWINWTTFDIIGNLAFGSDFGCLEGADYHPWVAMMTVGLVHAAKLLALKTLGFGKPISLILDSGLVGSYAHHMQQLREKLQRRIDTDPDRLDLIEGLIKQKDERLSLEHIQLNASTLIIAGSETTATLLSGALFCLLSNPEKLARVTTEVRSTFNSEQDIALMSVQHLPYLLACLNESLRFYPPVTLGMPRVVPAGGSTICGGFVPENTTVAVWQWAINHDKDLWHDPYGFHPERFLGEDAPPEFSNDRLDAMQPFSMGPRNCVGRNLAYAEMRLILARLVYNFDMKITDGSRDWLKNQKAYFVWDKPDLMVYLTPAQV